MKKILIAEGRSDAIVLRTLFAAADMAEVFVTEAGGKSSAISLGTSFALQSDTRVAIVVDADTTDAHRVQEQKLIFDDLQRRSPGSGTCKLFLAVPTLEGDLFPTAKEFSSVFNLNLTPRQVERYRTDWNLVVRAFLTTPEAGALPTIRTKGISRIALGRLFKKPLLGELKAFLGYPPTSRATAYT